MTPLNCEHPTCQAPPWRLRFDNMRRILVGPGVYLALVTLSELRRSRGPCEWLVYGSLIILTAVLTVGMFALHERKRRPPVLRFWRDGSPFALVIRTLRTGDVLLECDEPMLAGRDLQDVEWSMADLMNVEMKGTKLLRARMRHADLRGAALQGGDLRGADLAGALLVGARVAGADFQGADLRGTDFAGRGAGRVIFDHDLFRADLTGAFYNAATRWPRGFDPVHQGCILVAPEYDDLPIPAVARFFDSVPLPLASCSSEGPAATNQSAMHDSASRSGPSKIALPVTDGSVP